MTLPGSDISFQAINSTISKILFTHEDKFRVPRYQRSYAWKEDEVADFWDDLTGATTGHFLGAIILNYENYENDQVTEIIDGQQRLLTITILMAALRDIAKEFDKETANQIQTHSIMIKDPYGETVCPRIKCGPTLEKYFEEYIQGDKVDINDSAPTSKEERRVKSNYEFFRSKVSTKVKHLSGVDEKNEYINKIRKQIASLPIIKISIQSEEDAYEIFETTNARGANLTVADLLKNLILKNFKKKGARDTAEDLWIDIVRMIEATNTELKQFIRYYWISKHKFVSEKQVFRQIKNEIKTNEWEDFLVDLHDTAENYLLLLTGDEKELKEIEHGKKLYPHLFSIRLMGISQCYVFFLSVLNAIKRKKMPINPTSVFKLIEFFSFRYAVVCKQPGNRLEKIYSSHAIDLAKAISSSTEKHLKGNIQRVVHSLEAKLKGITLPYELFRDGFNDFEYRNSPKTRPLIKYALSRISAQQGDTGEFNFDNVNIEHILPQKPDKWKLTKKEIKEYVNKLGNLTLVHKDFNAKAGNKVIKEKIKEYRKCKIQITINLVKCKSQGPPGQSGPLRS